MSTIMFILISVILALVISLIYTRFNYNNYIYYIFENARKSAKKKNWDKIYLAIDIHDTIVYGNYDKDKLPTKFIGNAKKTLQYLSNRSDIELILYTCSHPKEIDKYLEFFKTNDISFKYINENLDIPNNALGCYDKKLYFNVLLDDKSGFDAEQDWDSVLKYVKSNNFNYSNKK